MKKSLRKQVRELEEEVAHLRSFWERKDVGRLHREISRMGDGSQRKEAGELAALWGGDWLLAASGSAPPHLPQVPWSTAVKTCYAVLATAGEEQTPMAEE